MVEPHSAHVGDFRQAQRITWCIYHTKARLLRTRLLLGSRVSTIVQLRLPSVHRLNKYSTFSMRARTEHAHPCRKGNTNSRAPASSSRRVRMWACHRDNSQQCITSLTSRRIPLFSTRPIHRADPHESCEEKSQIPLKVNVKRHDNSEGHS